MRASSIQNLAAAAIAFVWAWSGIAKFLNWSDFETALAGHGILPPELIRLGWVVPVTEVLLALAMMPSSLRSTKPSWKRFAILSVLAAGAVSLYAWRIPAEALQAVGCGCRGGISHPITIAGIPARAALLLTDAIFLCTHALLFLWPSTTPDPTPATAS